MTEERQPDEVLTERALEFVEREWKSLWRRINAGGLVQHQSELAYILATFAQSIQAEASQQSEEARAAVLQLASGCGNVMRESELKLKRALAACEKARENYRGSTTESLVQRAETAEQQLAEARAERDEAMHHLAVEMAKNNSLEPK